MIFRRIAMALLAGGVLWTVTAPVAEAQDDGWPHTPAERKARPNAASSGNFAVLQIATTDSDKLIADWQTTTPGASLTTSSQTSRNKPIVMFVIFKGCQVDARGDCNVTADFDAFDPSGKVYDHTKGARIWVGHPPPPNLGLQLSEAGYGLVIENKDPVGVYRVVATITDNLSGITLRTEQPFTVTP